MNERMGHWQTIQAPFRQIEASLFSASDGYVREVTLESNCAKTPPEFAWSCKVFTKTSEFKLGLDWADTRSAAFTCLSEGKYEPEIERILCEALLRSSRPVFIDVGANEGFHSLNCLSTIPEATVVAFEPNPLVRSRLERNLEVNGFSSRATVHPFGLSSNEGTADFYVPALTGSAGGSLENLHPEEGNPSTFSVQLLALDSLNLSPAVIKIDVEGNEMNVLLGAEETIARSRPTIVAELLRKWMRPFHSSPQGAANLILSHGYEMFAIGVDYSRKIEVIDEDTVETNFLFKPLPS